MAGRHGVAGAGRHGADIAARLGMARASWHAMAIAGRHGVARATGAGASRPGIARAGGLGTFAVPEPGEPVVHLKHAGVLWPDLGLHVESPVKPVGEPGCRWRPARGTDPPGRPQRARPAGLRWQARQAVVRCPCACPSPFKAAGLTVSGFGLLTISAWNHSRINMRSTLGLFMSFRGVACGQFRFLLYSQGADRVLPVEGLFMSAAG